MAQKCQISAGLKQTSLGLDKYVLRIWCCADSFWQNVLVCLCKCVIPVTKGHVTQCSSVVHDVGKEYSFYAKEK